jgi:hypothetical protein
MYPFAAEFVMPLSDLATTPDGLGASLFIPYPFGRLLWQRKKVGTLSRRTR